jgi:restriction endonuclease Mrr
MKHLFDNPRGSSSRTDPDYIQRVDQRNFEQYQAFSSERQRADFLLSLTTEERRVLREKLAFIDSVAKASASELTAKREPKLLSVEASELNKELCAYLTKHPEKLHALPPRKFEELVADILKNMGCDVVLTPQTRDGGRDILATFPSPMGKLLTIVECKRYSPENKVGIDLVERFLFVLDRKDNASCGMLVTTSFFSQEAVARAREWEYRLKLRDLDGVKEWLSSYGSWTRSKEAGLWVPKF